MIAGRYYFKPLIGKRKTGTLSGPLWRALFVVIASAMANQCFADDVYAVRFFGRSEPCIFQILWQDDIVLHNSGTTDQIVRLLGVSNGELVQPPETLLVPAGRTVKARGNVSWSPRIFVPIWVVHLDLPAGVIVQSRAEAHSDCCICGRPPSPSPDLGSFSLPTFHELTPAGTSKIHLGADLGSENSYVNVGVYNAAASPASASIELRQGCDDSVVDQKVIVIPPNSIVQVGPLSGVPSGCQRSQGGWTRYVKVKVDQPSLSYVINKKDGLVFPITVPYNAPF